MAYAMLNAWMHLSDVQNAKVEVEDDLFIYKTNLWQERLVRSPVSFLLEVIALLCTNYHLFRAHVLIALDALRDWDHRNSLRVKKQAWTHSKLDYVTPLRFTDKKKRKKQNQGHMCTRLRNVNMELVCR